MARLSTKISFAGNDIWQNTRKSLRIRTCTKAVCPLIIFTKPLKNRTNQEFKCHIVFLPKKTQAMENELIVDGNQPTCFGTGKNSPWESRVVRPVAHQIHSWIEVHHLGSNHPIRYSSVWNSTTTTTCRAMILIFWFYKRKSTHLQRNEYMGGHFMDPCFYHPKKKNCEDFVCFFMAKICDMSFIDQRVSLQ